MKRFFIHKDHAIKYQIGLWLILVMVYAFTLIQENSLAPYIFNAVFGGLYYLVSRVLFGKSKIWQALLIALINVIVIECLIIVFQKNGNEVSFIDIFDHLPVIAIMFSIDFFTEESLEIIEEVEEKLEHRKK